MAPTTQRALLPLEQSPRGEHRNQRRLHRRRRQYRSGELQRRPRELPPLPRGLEQLHPHVPRLVREPRDPEVRLGAVVRHGRKLRHQYGDLHRWNERSQQRTVQHLQSSDSELGLRRAIRDGRGPAAARTRGSCSRSSSCSTNSSIDHPCRLSTFAKTGSAARWKAHASAAQASSRGHRGTSACRRDRCRRARWICRSVAMSRIWR